MTARRIILLVLRIVLAVFFALQGLVKLTGSTTWVARFRGWGYPEHVFLAVGAAEVLGAILLAIPRTRAYGAVLLMAIMIGAAATHALHREPQLATAVVLFALLALVAFAGGRQPGFFAA
jgi:putative oxidoreductase